MAMDMMLLPLKRFAEFTGRSRRKEFWMFFLFQILVQLALLAIAIILYSVNRMTTEGDGSAVLTPSSIGFMVAIIIWLIFYFAMIIPNAAVIVRRFHDQNISGWVGGLLYAAMILITFTGIAILVFMCIDGKRGPNEYGPDPKSEGAGEVFL